MKNTIIKIITIIWTIFCAIGVVGNFSKYNFADWVFIIPFIGIPYFIIWKFYKKHTKEKSEIIIPVTGIIEPVETYIETDNMIYKPDGQKITDEEIPYLQQIGYEKVTASVKIPHLTRLLLESYTIMYNTNNPETLCSRYKFCIDNLEELEHYAKEGYYSGRPSIDDLAKLFSDDNYCSLIHKCYSKYMEKAKLELKTQSGITKRKQKFLEYIQQNVDMKILMKLSIF